MGWCHAGGSTRRVPPPIRVSQLRPKVWRERGPGRSLPLAPGSTKESADRRTDECAGRAGDQPPEHSPEGPTSRCSLPDLFGIANALKCWKPAVSAVEAGNRPEDGTRRGLRVDPRTAVATYDHSASPRYPFDGAGASLFGGVWFPIRAIRCRTWPLMSRRMLRCLPRCQRSLGHGRRKERRVCS